MVSGVEGCGGDYSGLEEGVGRNFHETHVITFCPVSDEQPYCLKYRYHRTLSEATPPGTPVLTILASDADLDPKLRFYLTGPGAESFSLDRDLGEREWEMVCSRKGAKIDGSDGGFFFSSDFSGGNR